MKKKASKKSLPRFKKKKQGQDGFVLDESLRVLGIELSKTLPTYDVPIDLVLCNTWNPNEMDDPMFNRLVQEIEDIGFIDPIQIIPHKGDKFLLIGGENRWAAVRTLGWEKIPSNIIMDERFLDPMLQKLVTVRLNVIAGKLNPDKFIKLKEEAVKKYGEDQLQALFGFTDTDAWKKLTKGVIDAVEKTGAGGKAVAGELKKRSGKVRTVDGLGVLISKLFKKYGNDLPHSFMVFSFGGKEHLYIIANDEMRQAIEVIKDGCRKKDLNINDAMLPAMVELAKKMKKGSK